MAQVEPRSYALADKTLTLRTALETDAGAVHAVFQSVYGETDFLSRYPDEVQGKAELVEKKIKTHLSSDSGIFLVGIVDGRIVALANLSGQTLRRYDHSAELALSVLKEFWGLGIGTPSDADVV